MQKTSFLVDSEKCESESEMRVETERQRQRQTTEMKSYKDRWCRFHIASPRKRQRERDGLAVFLEKH